MRNIIGQIVGFWVLVLLLCSCSTTRRVAPGEVLLQKNEISLNRSNFDREDLVNIVKQRPNGKILGLPMSLYIYNWGRKNKSGFFTRIGEPPVIYDSIAAHRSLSQMLIYLESKGYFNATGHTEVDTIHPKKVVVKYEFTIGTPYRIGEISFDIHSPQLRNLVGINRMETVLQTRDRYDVSTLDQERERLTKIFRDNGYYGFPRDLIRFEADSANRNNTIDLKLIITDFPIKNGDSISFVPHQPFTVNDIYIIPDFQYSRGLLDIVDTVDFMGYKILQTANPKFNARILYDVIHLNKNTTYREADVRQSYSHINSLNVFRSSEISFQRANLPEENLFGLDAIVRLTPFQKRSFTTEFQTLNTSGNFGISGNLGWVNRNTFRGGELLEFRIGGGVDAQANFRDNDDRVFNTTQISAEASLTFPRFILPFSTLGVFPKTMIPTTRLNLSYSRQVRLEFDRAVFNASLRYNWRESATKNHNLNLLDLNYLNALRVDQILLDNLLFVNNFQDNFIAAIRYSFTYTEQVYKKARHQNYLSLGVEFAGNLISVFDQINDFPTNTDGRSELLGVPYAQYARIDGDFRHFWNLPFQQQLVFRFLGGFSFGYNNSRFGAPFEKLYFGGGSYDIRAWRAFSLGPGSVPEEIFETIPRARYVATAPIKLMMNGEYRFPTSLTLPYFKDIKAALFVDAGNIWWNQSAAGQFQEGDLFAAYQDDFIFKIDRFYRQLAVGGGLGLRYDLSFFVVRLDMAYKFRDPAKPSGQTWFADPLRFGTLTYNIAIGYPF